MKNRVYLCLVFLCSLFSCHQDFEETIYLYDYEIYTVNLETDSLSRFIEYEDGYYRVDHPNSDTFYMSSDLINWKMLSHSGDYLGFQEIGNGDFVIYGEGGLYKTTGTTFTIKTSDEVRRTKNGNYVALRYKMNGPNVVKVFCETYDAEANLIHSMAAPDTFLMQKYELRYLREDTMFFSYKTVMYRYHMKYNEILRGDKNSGSARLSYDIERPIVEQDTIPDNRLLHFGKYQDDVKSAKNGFREAYIYNNNVRVNRKDDLNDFVSPIPENMERLNHSFNHIHLFSEHRAGLITNKGKLVIMNIPF